MWSLINVLLVSRTGNERSCGASLINVGVTVQEDCARIQFTGCGPVETYWCRLDRQFYRPCEFLVTDGLFLEPNFY